MRFKIEWVESDVLFIGFGLVIGQETIGLTISNLFIGFDTE